MSGADLVGVFTHHFFLNGQEADAWLDFECHEDEEEYVSYAYPDKHGEWQQWRQKWLEGLA